MMSALKIDLENCRYRAMLGVGGIGSGMFFKLNGNHTIGREESRSGNFLDRNDYCKLHIISHYVQTLLGAGFTVIPVGKVGADDVGKRLLQEMAEAGLTLNHVAQSRGSQTLFSFCFIYPDGSGGNLTTDDSACSKVDAAFIASAEPEFGRFAGQGIALAAPEVSMAARGKLLEYATEYGFYRVGSFTSEEIGIAVQSGMLRYVDLLAVNLDEAVAAVPMSAEDDHGSDMIIAAAIETFTACNPEMKISITQGKDGSWLWDGAALTHAPIHQVKVENTAGAGDAHLAGLIVGMTAGLSIQAAQQLAVLTAGSSVESQHTINKQTDRIALRVIADRSDAVLDPSVYELLENES
jgi:sugar/nucleoside kinase (ribokinase family)